MEFPRLLFLVTSFFAVGVSADAYAERCHRSSIISPVPFMGNDEVFKLADGSLWKVMFEYQYMYEYYPSVVICPSRGELRVNGKSLSVTPVSGGVKVRRNPERVRQGSVSELTSAVQVGLKLLGYECGVIDGKKGPNTIAAIRTFQRENQIPLTGQIDSQTRRKMSKTLMSRYGNDDYVRALVELLDAGSSEEQSGRRKRDRCYAGIGGPAYDGIGGPCYAGIGGPAYGGIGGPCHIGASGLSDECPNACVCKACKTNQN